MEVFKDYAYYYNMFYGDKNYLEEAKIIDDLIQKYRFNSKKVLNIGCGTGKHDNELNKLGYSIKGIDISSQMIEVARSNYQDTINEEFQFDIGDAKTYRDSMKYDVVTSLFHVMSYQNSNQDLLASFLSAREELVEGGLFIFDAWYGPGVLTDLPAVRIKKVADENNEIIRYATPIMHWNENIVDVCYDVHIVNRKTAVTSVINEIHRMRYLFKPEVQYMLEQCGFELIDCIDCKSFKEPDNHSWTVYFVALKK